MTKQTDIAREHMALVHPDGSDCPDGCDLGPLRTASKDQPMTLYVYDVNSLRLLARIKGDTNRACESKAKAHGYESEDLGWTYSPAFGVTGGLIDVSGAAEIE